MAPGKARFRSESERDGVCGSRIGRHDFCATVILRLRLNSHFKSKRRHVHTYGYSETTNSNACRRKKLFDHACRYPCSPKLLQLLPLTLRLHDYGGFEKVGALGTRLPSDDVWMTARTGDVVLYNSNQIVLMCGSNSWNYTRLGHVSDSGDWIKTLGDKDVEIQLIAR